MRAAVPATSATTAVIPNYYAEALTYLEHCFFVYYLFNQTHTFMADPYLSETDNYTYGIGRKDGLRKCYFTGIEGKIDRQEYLTCLSVPNFQFTTTDPIILGESVLRFMRAPQFGARVRDIYLHDGSTVPVQIGIKGTAGLAAAATASAAAPDMTVHCFIGKTGDVPGKAKGVASLLGYVAIDRTTQTIVVAFRGSQSGNGEQGPVCTAARSAFFSDGNPDWVTDLQLKVDAGSTLGIGDLRTQIPLSIGRAFVSAIPALKVIFAGLNTAEQGYEVRITGHSLGGGLAAICQMAFHNATFRANQLGVAPTSVLNRSISRSFCHSFSAPSVVGHTACDHIAKKAPSILENIAAAMSAALPLPAVGAYGVARPPIHATPVPSFNQLSSVPGAEETWRWYIPGDPVVTTILDEHYGISRPLAALGISGPDCHEPAELQRHIFHHIYRRTIAPTDKLWVNGKDCAELAKGVGLTGKQVKEVFLSCFQMEAFVNLVDCLRMHSDAFRLVSGPSEQLRRMQLSLNTLKRTWDNVAASPMAFQGVAESFRGSRVNKVLPIASFPTGVPAVDQLTDMAYQLQSISHELGHWIKENSTCFQAQNRVKRQVITTTFKQIEHLRSCVYVD